MVVAVYGAMLNNSGPPFMNTPSQRRLFGITLPISINMTQTNFVKATLGEGPSGLTPRHENLTTFPR